MREDPLCRLMNGGGLLDVDITSASIGGLIVRIDERRRQIGTDPTADSGAHNGRAE